MNNELCEAFAKMGRSLLDYEIAQRQALGFSDTIEYKKIYFHVSSHFVIADLSPLAFIGLVEYIDGEDADAAVGRLYDRLLPLLACEHQWTIIGEDPDEQIERIADKARAVGSVLHVCGRCTAYTMNRPGDTLPSKGRMSGLCRA